MTTINETAADKLIMTDEGTHTHPRTTRVYLTAAGKFRTVVKYGDGLISEETTDTCPKESGINTEGRVRHFGK